MSSGALTQLIASGGNADTYVNAGCASANPSMQRNVKPTYVCLNQQCFIDQPSEFGQLHSLTSLDTDPTVFGSLEECRKVCGVRPSTRRPQ
jgi:hypothetical protein